MPIFSLSPAVEIKEQDLTLIVPAVSTSIGGFSGVFVWGPVDEVTVVDTEKTLASVFGKPDEKTARDFLTAANFLSYSNNLKTVRVVGDMAYNAASPTPTGGEEILVKNLIDYENKVSGFADNNASAGVKWVAKFPGALGNSVTVSMADSATFADWAYRDQFGSQITTNKVADTATDTTLTFTGANTTAGIRVGMIVTGTGIAAGTTVVSVDSATQVTLSQATTATATDVAIVFTAYTGAPGTSSYVSSKGGSNDEVHVVVVDTDGLWTGEAGTVMERYVGLSKAFDAKDFAGARSYYAEVLNRDSAYVWFGGTHEVAGWGGAATVAFASLTSPLVAVLAGGADDNEPSVAKRIAGYVPFTKPEEVDVNLVMVAGLASATDAELLSDYAIDNIANLRKDCIVLLSPPLNAVVNNSGNELQSILDFKDSLNSSSYAVLDTGWKYQYDRYADVMRWVPLCADIAGLCAYTDAVADAWFSPAGLNRGFIKNVVKLAYNPGSKAERDTLYINGINPVTNLPGEGTVLYGDKTMQAKPSAFDRINVRRLFITVEKAIASAAKYQLFEFNDAFTRGRFVGAVEPFLREVQGRRGITDFRVVCDETNNTAEVIDSNGFVADIYIKPARSINFIQLNFVASPTGVSFEEIA